ncbi:hypothetical protein [Pelomonas cellulosilytica]|uniref:PEP-CTERM protein-sorting domain-containing protein n=1 Tax=Pelomonas cellulosilytica TaxID=2906762 RepID=A0ABS8XW93_9BURK|nr:hypothetical protein [Pelomonas sp. P8]MCE4556924.1 hypothetical protein [Pelomonas sp. P8]
MRVISKFLALLVAAALQPAVAGVVSLDFEDLKVNAADPNDLGIVELLDRYKSSGFGFSAGAWGVVSAGCGGAYAFGPHLAGTCSSLLVAGDPLQSPGSTSPLFTLDFASGFVADSSLYFSALPSARASIAVFDDVGGKGNQLAEFSGLAGSICSTGDRFCTWDVLDLKFVGTARSIVVSAADQSLMIDDIRLNQASTSPGPLPEPASLALAVGALGALGWTRKRVRG